MPWYDETMFASVVSSVMNLGRFEAEVNTTVMGGEQHLMYGPVFFYLEAVWCKLFSFGLVSYRSFVLLSGLLSMFFTYLVITKLNLFEKPLLHYLFVLVLITDAFWASALHEGRMDLLAISFALAGFYIFLLNKKNIYYDVSIGVLFSLALLTTPRIIVLLLPIGLFIFYSLYKSNSYKSLLPFLIIPIFSYFCWIYGAYGSFENFLNYVFGDSIGIGQYSSGGLFDKFYFIPTSMKPLLAITAMSFLCFVFLNKPLLKIKLPILICCLIGIAFHYLCIVDWGPYAIYISPLLYFILILSIANFKYWKLLIIPLLSINVVYWSLKIAFVLNTSEARNEATALTFIKNYIPEKSNIIGDAQYYFIAKANSCKYEYLDKYGDLDKRARLHIEKYNYEYIIISDQEASRCTIDLAHYKSLSPLKIIARLDYPAVKFPLVSGFDSKGYACTIYKRMD